MTDFYNVNVAEELPNNVTVDGGLSNIVTITEEQENIVRIASRGIQGPPGTQIIDGTGTPSNSIGRIGDFFLDTSASLIWGPKSTSGWGDPASFGSSTISELEDTTVSLTVEDQSVLMWDAVSGTWRDQRVRYVHTQSVPSDSWTIAHGLRGKPSGVSIFDTSGTQVFGEVVHDDDNNLTLNFSASFAGIVYLG